jgi:hypothetical protein
MGTLSRILARSPELFTFLLDERLDLFDFCQVLMHRRAGTRDQCRNSSPISHRPRRFERFTGKSTTPFNTLLCTAASRV